MSRWGRATGIWSMNINGFPTGKPTRDIIATDGMKITLGRRTVLLYLILREAVCDFRLRLPIAISFPLLK
jgi:hypothetical protein